MFKNGAQAIFLDGAWRAVVDGRLQRPTFNARGPAIIFAIQAQNKVRKEERIMAPYEKSGDTVSQFVSKCLL